MCSEHLRLGELLAYLVHVSPWLPFSCVLSGSEVDPQYLPLQFDHCTPPISSRGRPTAILYGELGKPDLEAMFDW